MTKQLPLNDQNKQLHQCSVQILGLNKLNSRSSSECHEYDQSYIVCFDVKKDGWLTCDKVDEFI